jgi:hypothetical protein
MWDWTTGLDGEEEMTKKIVLGFITIFLMAMPLFVHLNFLE